MIELFLQVDFGLSRDDFPGGSSDVVTATKCGTKEYMAPEVYRKQPYGFAADWWSFGAVSFDLMTNKVPIVEQDYEKSIEFPSSMSRLAKDLLKR
jgi:serine/threonine protein kinase